VRAGSFRFAVGLAIALAVAALSVAAISDLPMRDPDGVQVKTYIRLPLILLATFLADVVPRAVRRSRGLRRLPSSLVTVVRERWPRDHIRFALVGLGAWYVTYVAFRNLKSYVPFVNDDLYDDELGRVDRVLWLGHDPASVLHDVLGTGAAAHFLSFIYVAWIVLVPASLVIALAWSRDVRAGEWFVTAIAVDWALGVATYFVVPSLGPIYTDPALFDDLPQTWVSSLQATMLQERAEVLLDPFGTGAVQTIAAFASLHVGITVTICLMAELLDMPRWVTRSLWIFLGLTVLSTVYLGWHYFADALGGAVIGALGVLVAAWGTGNLRERQAALARPR
jgi:hypothetical protein